MLGIKRTRQNRVAVLAAFCLGASPALSAEPSFALPEFVPVVWVPSASTKLASASVKLSGISTQPGRHQIGDTVTVLLRCESGFRFDNPFFSRTGLDGLTVNKLDNLQLRLLLPSLVGHAWCIFPAFPRAES
ncbi:MAG TPA: hypothetical protein VL069_13885 [Opitutus sp.]|nr:hypothetical protein [Opitutus sp.]